MHSVMDERLKLVFGWVYLPHNCGCDGRGEEGEDNDEFVEIDFSVVGSYC